jgi:hypothetical protein
MADRKLDIFGILKALDTRDIEYPKSIPDEEKTEFFTFVRYPALRWMSGAMLDKDHMTVLISTNLVNPLWFSLAKHPDWQASLLAVTGTGKSVRHSYIQPPKAVRNSLLMDFVRSHYSSDLDTQDCEYALKNITRDEFVDLASGMENKVDLVKAYDTWRQNIDTKNGLGQKARG